MSQNNEVIKELKELGDRILTITGIKLNFNDTFFAKSIYVNLFKHY